MATACTCTCTCTCGVCRLARIIARRPGAHPRDLDEMGTALATLVLDPEARGAIKSMIRAVERGAI